MEEAVSQKKTYKQPERSQGDMQCQYNMHEGNFSQSCNAIPLHTHGGGDYRIKINK